MVKEKGSWHGVQTNSFFAVQRECDYAEDTSCLRRVGVFSVSVCRMLEFERASVHTWL